MNKGLGSIIVIDTDITYVHVYTRFDKIPPTQDSHYMQVITKKGMQTLRKEKLEKMHPAAMQLEPNIAPRAHFHVEIVSKNVPRQLEPKNAPRGHFTRTNCT